MATRPKTHKAYIGLGSNLGDSYRHVTEACREINAHPHITLLTQSLWYRSKAVGPGEQDDYVNGAILVETPLAPEALLDALQKIEQQHNRERIIRWGARTLDLDILLFDEQQINTSRLTVPHPELCHRNFVLQPLVDINRALSLPNGRLISDFLHIIGTQGLNPVAEHE